MPLNPFETYSISLLIFPVIVIGLLICQILSDKYVPHKKKDKYTKVLLYGIYVASLGCNTFGYTLHASKNNPDYCKFYGFPPCFMFYGSAKAFTVGFFLRRAKKSNVTTKFKYKDLFFDKIGPMYTFVYWVVYVTLAGLVFTGTPTEYDPTNMDKVISFCSFGGWSWWFVILANFVDFFNCIASLLVFLYPLVKAIQQSRKHDHVNERLLAKFLRCMKWNVVLTFIAVVSSLGTLASIPTIGVYIWVLCTGDPLVNSVCAFAMMASNRKFIRSLFTACKCEDMGHVSEVTSLSPGDDTMKSVQMSHTMATQMKAETEANTTPSDIMILFNDKNDTNDKQPKVKRLLSLSSSPIPCKSPGLSLKKMNSY